MVSIVYFDTSALLKQYVTEIGSGWVRALLSSADPPIIFTSRLTIVEAASAFARRLREGRLSSTDHTSLLSVFDYDMNNKYYLLEVTHLTVDTARGFTNRHPLRAYDAMQLATAWLLNRELLLAGKSPLTFICADRRLITIAQAVGLLTENPWLQPLTCSCSPSLTKKDLCS